MKTNRFEETIRKKVEGVQPEFAEDDWSRFQKFYKANTSGSFWKTYGSKIAYGAAASFLAGLSIACGLLYRQNSEFRKEIAELKQIINRYENVDSQSPGDNMELSAPDNAAAGNSTEYNKDETRPATTETGSKAYTGVNPATVTRRQRTPTVNAGNSRFGASQEAIAYKDRENIIEAEKLPVSEINPETIAVAATETRINDSRLPELTEIARENKPGEVTRRGISASGLSRISARKVVFPEKKAPGPSPHAEPQQQKNILPTFITSRPYRIGLTAGRTKNMSTFGAVNEFLLFPNISVTWGINRALYDKLEFFNEKVFIEQTGQNFRKTFGKGGPLVGDVMNITTHSALTQIPLFVGYRQPLRQGFVLTASVGTHLNVRFRQTLEYDFWDGHQLRKISGLKYRKLNYPVVNNFSPALGVEKIFDPVVIQAEAYYHFQDKDIPYVDAPGGVGARLKLLYQFGR